MKTTSALRPWFRERERLLRRIAPHAHFHRVFDGLPDIHFYVKNVRGQTLFCSAGLPAHHGLPDENAMLGKTDSELTPGVMADEYSRGDMEIIRTGRPLPQRLEVWVDNVGLPDWYLSCKYPIKDRRGRVIGIMGTLRQHGGAEAIGAVDDRLAPAMAAIIASTDRFPPVASLARGCSLSVRQFQRAFHAALGMSPRTYWMKLRIRAACKSLRQGHESVVHVASRLGFWDQSSFTAHFRRHTGSTPAAFARANRAAPTGG